MASHYLFEPTACTPSAGWEKGQVERQVGAHRGDIFVPRLRFESFRDMNAHLAEQMIVKAHNSRHPEFTEKTVYQVFQEERPYLIRQAHPFGGYVSETRSAGTQCLVRFDGNNYSIPCEHSGKEVEVRIFAERIAIAVKGATVAEHERSFDRGAYILNPLHYVPLLERKPGALRNGRPFLNWELPGSIRKVWDSLRRYSDWDRQMSRLLATIPAYGVEALAVACEMALEEGAVSESIIMNYLTRLSDEAAPAEVAVPEKLALQEAPRPNCEIYDMLLEGA